MTTGGLRLEYRMGQFGHKYLRPLVMITLACDPSVHKTSCPAVVLPALIDTGADTTCIPLKYARDCGHQFLRGKPVEMGGATGAGVARLHSCRIQITGPGAQLADLQDGDFLPWTWNIRAYVCDKLEGIALLGCQDFLTHWDFCMSKAKGTFSLTPVSPDVSLAVRRWRAARGAK